MDKKALSVPTFVIEQITYGWADVSIRHDHVIVFADQMSYLSDGLADFVTMVLIVVTNELPGAECRWEQEPGHYVFTLREQRGNVELTISFDEDNFYEPPKDPHRIYRVVYHPCDFARSIINGFETALENYGRENYETRWGYPYPELSVSELKTWLNNCCY